MEGDCMKQIEIVTYEEKYHDDFKRLGYEWLEKYVTVEPEDIKILTSPKEVILDTGGFIFFAKYQNEIVGTVSLIKVDETTYELAKLAVTEKYKGLKLGNLLMETAIQQAKEQYATKIILYTDHKLATALVLYQKFGFQEIPMINNKYIDSDLMMELSI
jgi:ribosomal protein S18 acetylase RimI-like enzyme